MTVYHLRDKSGVEVFTGTITPAPGGGSQPFTPTSLAFDTPGLAVQAFPVTAVDQESQTFTIAGAHADLFPEDMQFLVTGSTGNDAEYTVASVAEGGGSTVVTTVEALPDATADGDLNNTATAGVVLSEKTGYLFDVLDVTTAFDGAANPTLYIGPLGCLTSIGPSVISSYSSLTDPSSSPTAETTPFSVMHRVVAPVMAILANDNNVGPGSTQGEATVLLGMLP